MTGERRRLFAIIAGGGTAGHVLPAIAIGRALVSAGHDPATLLFVGSRRGLEARLVPEAGFSVTLLPGRGIERRLSLASIGAVVGLVVAVGRGVLLVVRARPAVVVSVGGYAGFPCAFAAVVLRIPLVLADSNALPGASNRVVARFAKASAVAFPDTGLPRAVVTGSPVRPEVLAVERTDASCLSARQTLGLPLDAVVVASFGGSLGALKVNRAVLELVSLWIARDDVAIRHILGRRDHERLAAELPRVPEGGILYQAVDYENRMELVYAAADVMVCRAGGTTVAELGVVGLPAVLIPLPGAPGDHQTINARSLVDVGAAVLVPDSECTGARLAEELDPIVRNAERRAAMGAAARGRGVPEAADRVAALVEHHARRRRRP